MPGRESSLSSVQKACRILGVLADTGRARLTEISVKATLNKVTTLRILEVLARDDHPSVANQALVRYVSQFVDLDRGLFDLTGLDLGARRRPVRGARR